MVWMWIGFIVFVLVLLALDLGIFHRKAHEISVREALGWSTFWISLGLLFSAFVYFAYEYRWLGLGVEIDAVDGSAIGGRAALLKYLTGYVVEKSLSVDNIFVMLLIFSAFAVPSIYQHRVLFWGIVGALIMRGAIIGVGYELILHFHWVLYVFGAFLILTAVKMLVSNDEHKDPSQNPVVRLVRRFLPVTDGYHGSHFIVRAGSQGSQASAVPGGEQVVDRAASSAPHGRLMLTPLALSLATVEFTDLVFAVDSIPAVFAITADPFLVFTSNVFAMLGLRSLYFALAGSIAKLRYLKHSLAVVLGVVGAKMLAAHWIKATLGANANLYMLALVMVILAIGIGCSLLIPTKPHPRSSAESAKPALPKAL